MKSKKYKNLKLKKLSDSFLCQSTWC